MKSRSFFVIGSLSLLLPLYNFTGWIYICSKYASLSHLERVDIFKQLLWFDAVINLTKLTFVSGILGLSSVAFLFFWILPKLKTINTKKDFYYITQLVLFIIAVFVTTWHFWTLM
jgi:hypothetical protein